MSLAGAQTSDRLDAILHPTLVPWNEDHAGVRMRMRAGIEEQIARMSRASGEVVGVRAVEVLGRLDFEELGDPKGKGSLPVFLNLIRSAVTSEARGVERAREKAV
jgi:hypothetical protein